jgi:thiamine biosynthesis lipoprotein
LGALFLIFFLSACSKSPYQESRFLLGTVVKITVREESSEKAQRAVEAAFQRIREIESLMSIYKEGSEASSLNRKAGKEAVKVSPEVFKVIKKSLRYSEITEGAFDITLGILGESWGFKDKKYRLPQEEEVRKGLRLVNYKDILLDEERGTIRFRKKGMRIDLGGVAKGYAVEEAIKELRKEEIRKALVNAGGDIQGMGEREWKIGLKHPRKKGETLATLKLKNQAVATSGDYEKFFFKGERRYHHLLDPQTGKPAQGSISVTILAPGATIADILATAVFVLGPSKGMELIEKLEDTEGIIVTPENEVKVSSGLEDI